VRAHDGPVLQLRDFDAPFVVDCDASGTGFDAVLHQGHSSIAFFSRAVYLREPFGLVQAVRHWCPYR
jgi:hypothetical protein